MQNINKIGSNGVPTLLKNRTHRVTNPTHLTTFNASELVPIFCFETLPGGTYKLDIGTICRMPALKHPVMGKLWLDCYAFYVPYDLIDEKFDKLIGEGHDNTFIEALYGRGSHNPNPQSVGQSIVPDLFVPHIEGSAKEKTFDCNPSSEAYWLTTYRLLNYLGLPWNKEKGHYPFNYEYDEFISSYRIRAYNLIYSCHFRHPFLENPLITDFNQPVSYLFEDDEEKKDTKDPNLWVSARYKLMRVNRSPDYFSKGFVRSQLNTGIGIDLGGDIPITFDKGTVAPVSGVPGSVDISPDGVFSFRQGDSYPGKVSVVSDVPAGSTGQLAVWNNGQYQFSREIAFNYSSGLSGFANGKNMSLQAQLDGITGKVNAQASFDINQLRNAIVLQHISEKALYGTDMKTILKTSFAVSLPDYKLDEPLFIGGRRVPIQINQVTNTTNTLDKDGNLLIPTGEYAGQSTTIDNLSGVNGDNIFFTAYNYGVIMVLVCVRHESVYQYGISPGLLLHDKFDFYWPEFAGLSNVPMKERIIYRNGHQSDDNRTFNFQPYGAEYLNDSNRVSGDFASSHPQSLDDWHLADIYDSAPYFTSEWMKDTTKEVLQRCLALDSSNAPQFAAYFMCTYSRDVPVAITEPGVFRI